MEFVNASPGDHRMQRKPQSIDEYLDTLSPEPRAALARLRRTILSILGDAQECISYSMPAFRYGGHVIAGFRATAKGCSYYPFSGTTLDTVTADIEAYGRTKSALHFNPKQPLPVTLVRKLLKARIAETAGRGAQRRALRAKRARSSARKKTGH